MKTLIRTGLLSLLVSFAANAAEYPQHDMQQIVRPSSESGHYALNLRYIDQVIDDLYGFAGSYPPSFETGTDANRARKEIAALTHVLDLGLQSSPDRQLLSRAALLHRMGHNLDMPDSWKKAETLYQKLLAIAPDDLHANYQYGLFLAETGQSSQSLPYLERATRANYPPAYFTLALAYFATGDANKAKENLQVYLQHNANDKNAKALLEAMEDGRAQIMSTPAKN